MAVLVRIWVLVYMACTLISMLRLHKLRATPETLRSVVRERSLGAYEVLFGVAILTVVWLVCASHGCLLSWTRQPLAPIHDWSTYLSWAVAAAMLLCMQATYHTHKDPQTYFKDECGPSPITLEMTTPFTWGVGLIVWLTLHPRMIYYHLFF